MGGTPAPGVAKWSAGVRRAIAETATTDAGEPTPPHPHPYPQTQAPDAARLDAVVAATGQ